MPGNFIVWLISSESIMNFSRVFFFVFSVLFMLCAVNAAPRWKGFKKIEKFGRNIRDGIAKAGPAVGVVGQATAIAKG